jgi:cytochrome P450
LKLLQESDPVHWSEVLRGWVITRYDDVRRIQLNRDFSADRLTPFYESLSSEDQSGIATLIRYLNTWVAFKDPPDYGRLRSLMNQMFQATEISALEPFVVGAVSQLLDGLEG